MGPCKHILTTIYIMVSLCSALMSASIQWNVNDGTWDDATSAHWNPAQVPTGTDTVVLDTDASGANIEFAATIYTGSTNHMSQGTSDPGLQIGGSGNPVTLNFRDGDRLQYSAKASNHHGIVIDNGGTLRVHGGTLQDLSTIWNWGIKVKNGGNLIVTGGNIVMARLSHWYLADDAGESAYLEVSGNGQILKGTTLGGSDLRARSGNSTVLIKDNGILEVNRTFFIGTVSGDHHWTISGGNLDLATTGTYGGYIGGGTASVNIIQNGGNVIETSATMDIDQGVDYQLSAGNFKMGNLKQKSGNIFMTGGHFEVQYEYNIGSSANSSAYMSMDAVNSKLICRGLALGTSTGSGGAFDSSTAGIGGNSLLVHHAGNIQVANATTDFRIGHPLSSATSSYQPQGGTIYNKSAGGDTYVYQSGNINGYGLLDFAGFFLNNGQIIANGFGSEQTLNLTNYSSIQNTVDNSHSKGWFATQKGKLDLPDLSVSSGSSNLWWGEDSSNDGDGVIDLVNSLQINFSNVQSTGPLSISLLATDHSSVPAMSSQSFGHYTPLTVWSITDNGSFDLGSGHYSITTRYPEHQLPSQNSVHLFQHNGSQWQNITASVDRNSKTITSRSITSLGPIALMYSIPKGVLFYLQ